eukprot:Blabericola_migrator_1__3640@NODE_208_length_11399_cov_361_320155_g179_i0_p2_GENE_NODE_208_length_11399_cov_361_320155_g179_i0NODE_208_length_11399_cov_361_320155_g179_i0_p2_ORF_typecomplete_len325_score47_94ProkRING_1/PF14446_6/0_03ProkRING_1/PF14446_6/9e02FANCL_C/PF11793_8/0_34Phage_holin_3_6/PF07332_11/0_31DUF3341/PF11821_8/0_38DUF1700/PF08006_11/0_72Zn_ribbon_17/PF17120_5/3RINGv/PF12906_7/1_2RINGv/PF12906_7/5_7e02DUF2180/PF09947_9/1_1DUF2180/PF09947_9/1_2e04Promethin/PF16015_5/4_4zfRING_2/PF
MDTPSPDRDDAYRVEYDALPNTQPAPRETSRLGDFISTRILENIFGVEKRRPPPEDETLVRYPPRFEQGDTPRETLTGACFICLEDGSRRPLVACCSQCSAVTHEKCWFRWRRRQRLATLRARLLATNITDPLCCTICKTGVAQIAREEGRLGWAAEDPVQQRLQDKLLSILGRMLQATRGDDEESVSLPPVALQRIAVAAAIIMSLGVVINVLVFAFSSITYWGLIVIPTFAFLYLLGAIGCIAVVIYQRRLALGPLRHRPSASRTPRVPSRELAENFYELPLQAVAHLGRRAYCHDVCVELWDIADGPPDVVIFCKQENANS